MNIVKKEYYYIIDESNLTNALMLNDAFAGTGVGGAATPKNDPATGFTFVLLMNTDPNGMLIFTTYNEENFPEELQDLLMSCLAQFGAPLKD